MRQVVIDRFYSWSRQFEGEVPWMYLDVKGLVTTGIGNLIDPVSQALQLPWLRADGSPATKAEVSKTWATVKAHTELARKGHLAARAYCPLRLAPEAIDALVRGKLALNWEFMKRQYPTFRRADSWPAKVQLATSGMAWAVGAGFPKIFKNWAACATLQDWAGCAKTCAISTKGNPGIVPRNAAQKALFEQAAVEGPDKDDTL